MWQLATTLTTICSGSAHTESSVHSTEAYALTDCWPFKNAVRAVMHPAAAPLFSDWRSTRRVVGYIG